MNQFSELSLSAQLHSNLARNNFVTPTPVQAEAVPAALTGRDVIATAQTGTGKTLAFVLPLLEALLRRQQNAASAPHHTKAAVEAVVLSPTRELAIQIHETFEKLAQGTGIRAAVVVGGINEQRQLHALRGGARVAIATPGRLVDFLDRKLVRLNAASVVVLDEADRMLDMGFLPSLKRILSACPEQRQMMFFSATIEASVAHLIREHLKNPIKISIDPVTRPAENVRLELFEVEQPDRFNLLRSILTEEQGSVLVFARTKHGTDRLAKNLARCGIHAGRIHGDRTQAQRNQALAAFRKGDTQVLVATDVAARGIHVDGIAHVVNFDLPQVPEDFIHRVGRTGRAGMTGVATTFAGRGERGEIRRIEKLLQVQMVRRQIPDMSGLPPMSTAPHTGNNVIVLPVKAGRSAAKPAYGARPSTGQGRRKTFARRAGR